MFRTRSKSLETEILSIRKKKKAIIKYLLFRSPHRIVKVSKFDLKIAPSVVGSTVLDPNRNVDLAFSTQKMSYSFFTKYIGQKFWIPLWKRAIPQYPVYWKGDPQLRIFLPHFWMKLVRPETNERKDKVHFIVHPQMSEEDVQQYLKKIYNVETVRVTFHYRAAPPNYNRLRGFRYPDDPDIKYAYCYLKDEEFTFPEMIGKENSPQEQMIDEYNKIEQRFLKEKKKASGRLDIPAWFR